MNVVLTDHLVCPRCGPPFGLVLLARDVRDRRVHEGVFGCPNCRDRFPVERGFGDLRPPPRGVREVGDEAGIEGQQADDGAGSEVGKAALRLAAMLGVTSGPGLIVVADRHRAEAVPLARLVRGIEVVVVGWGGRGLAGEGVTAFVTGPRLPLRDGVVRGVVAVGGSGEGWWGECLRVVMPGGRIVITGATEGAGEWVVKAGLVTMLDEGGVVVGGGRGRGWGRGRGGGWGGIRGTALEAHARCF